MLYKLFFYIIIFGKMRKTKAGKVVESLKKHLSGAFQRKTVERLRAGDSSMIQYGGVNDIITRAGKTAVCLQITAFRFNLPFARRL